MKKLFKIVGILTLVLVLFRGWIYRNTINYTEIGTRKTIEITNQKLKDKINNKVQTKSLDFDEIVQITKSLTNQELRFTFKKTTNNPNKLVSTKKANCIGYSAMFNSIANYLVKKYQLKENFVVEHKIGKLDFMGFDLHKLFDNPFFKDHDFNIIKDIKSRKEILFDPSVSDILGINFKYSKSETNTPKEANLVCDNLFAKGKLGYDNYTFCSTIPKEIQYSYKKGKWRFWDKLGNIIAEGNFNLEKQKIEDQGGCTFELINSKIDENQWIFWDKLGNSIKPNDKIINKLESCTITAIVKTETQKQRIPTQ